MLYTALLFVRTCLFNAGYYGSGIVMGALSVMLWPILPYRWRYPIINCWNRFVMVWLRICCGIKLNIIGERHRELQPYVVMAKHQSTWETLFLQYYFEPISTILKKELFQIPFFGWGLASLKPIGIDRSHPMQALKDVKTKSVARLKEGLNVMVFPEGTRIALGEVGTYARSGADIAASAGRPIIPIAHNGAECWPHKEFLKRPGTITVKIGAPIFPEGRDRKVLTTMVQEWVEGEIKNLPVGRRDGQRPWQDNG